MQFEPTVVQRESSFDKKRRHLAEPPGERLHPISPAQMSKSTGNRINHLLTDMNEFTKIKKKQSHFLAEFFMLYHYATVRFT